MITVILSLSLLFLRISAAPQQQLTWDDAYAKAKASLAGLSLQDKVAIASGTGWQNGPCVGNTAPVPSVKGYNGLCMQDSPTGIRFVNNVSAFPASLNLASTFDRKLMLDHGTLIGAEFRGAGVNLFLGPMMNLLRNPDAGRNWEGQGADPYLAAESAKLQVRGIQSQGVIATAKHFILNEQETFRSTSSSNIDDRTLHEMYLKPFKACIEEGVGAIMCSYNLINQTYSCENDHILNAILKTELGFKGFVMTDWWATKNAVEASKGTDMMMPGDTAANGPQVWGQELIKAVYSNRIPQSRVDDMATRILAAWYKLGQDNGYPRVKFNSFNVSALANIRADHHLHIRKVGGASSILLKNCAHILPLKSDISIAVLGSDAGPGLSTNNSDHCIDHGCSSGTIAQGWGSGTSNFPYVITPLEGIQNRATKSGVRVSFSLSDSDLQTASKLAASADVTIVFVSADSGEEYLIVEGNVGDRTASGLSLWKNGDELINQAAKSSKNVIVVIHAPSAVDMPWLDNPSVVGVIFAGFPGQESGNSIADILFGDVNPSGRLPFSIMKNLGAYSSHVMTDPFVPHGLSVPQIHYSEGLFVDYRWNDAKNITPIFEFGFGLSFTTFAYDSFSLCQVSNQVSVSFTVRNTGAFDGHEVAQLYLGFPAQANEPPKQLKDFDRQMIAAGASASFKLTVPASEMQIWDTPGKKWVTPSGTFQVYIGSSSRKINWQGRFSIQ